MTIILISSDIGKVENRMFLLLYLSSATNFDIDIGKLNVVIVIAREKVGKISVYRLIPSRPMVLVIIIFMNKPSILVMNPPITKMIVDLINFSFIFYIYVKKIKKEDKFFFIVIPILIIGI